MNARAIIATDHTAGSSFPFRSVRKDGARKALPTLYQWNEALVDIVKRHIADRFKRSS